MVSNASAALMGRVWHFGFSIMGLGYAGGQTKVDLSNLALGNGGLTRAVGPGSSHSGELSLAGQQFADSLASQGLATQNQAEEIVFQAEQFGMNTGDGSLQQNIQNILAATRDNNGGSLDRFFTENQSGVDIRGIVLQEYAVAFAHPFFDMVSVGASAKVLYGTTYYKPYSLSDIQNAKDLFKDLVNSKNREESLNLGVDVGALVQPMDWISLGIVGRNLNRPEFDFKGPGKYVVEPQVRAGVGLTPLPGLTLAGDVDLYINHSEALPGYDSQMLGGGAEYALLDILFLRGGVSKNIAEPTENVMFHLGLGLRVLSVDVDLAASIVPEFTKLESGGGTAELPERAGASLLIGVNIPLN